MKRLKKFVVSGIVGGFIVLIPVPLLFFIGRWIWNTMANIIRPLSDYVLQYVNIPEIVANLLAIFMLLLVCFFVGSFVKTRIGQFIYEGLENVLFKKIPFYTTVKDLFANILGRDGLTSFSPALVRPFGGTVWMTGFITARHDNGMFTVLVPSALTPTSGLIFHLCAEDVIEIDVPKNTILRTIIGGGVGSEQLIASSKKDLNHTTKEQG